MRDDGLTHASEPHEDGYVDEAPMPSTDEGGPAGPVRRVSAGLLAAAALAVATAGAGGWAIGHAGSSPSSTSVEAGFARDMTTHHDQAVQRAMIIHAKTTDPDIRQLAYDIATTQAHQSGQMMGWLRQWGLDATGDEPRMAWMARAGHDHGSSEGLQADGRMPGMASNAELKRLQTLTGKAADVHFLELMIPHHEAGAPMAKAAVAGSDDPAVDDLARSIVASQTAEIVTMQEMLAERQ